MKRTSGTIDHVKRAAANAADLVVLDQLNGATAERFRTRLDNNLQSLVGGRVIDDAIVGPVSIRGGHIECEIFIVPLLTADRIHFTFTLSSDHEVGHVYNQP